MADLDGFWGAVWDYFDIAHDGRATAVRIGDMPTCRWFAGTSVNYAEHLLRTGSDHHTAIVALDEDGVVESLTWGDLRAQVASLAGALRSRGIGRGDSVVALLPNITAAAVGFAACAAVGATWAVSAPEFGAAGVAARFGPLAPRVLITVDGYRYGGKDYDRAPQVGELIEALSSLELVIAVGVDASTSCPRTVPVVSWDDLRAVPAELAFDRVPFDHPLWVLFSSGTTGRPKGIVHGHGGALVEHLKVTALHNDIGPTDRVMVLASTSWMMWNALVSSLLTGATILLFNGSPTHPDLEHIWRLCHRHRVTMLGVAAGYVDACMSSGVVPATIADLGSLTTLRVTGAPLSAAAFHWVYASVAPDVWLTSPSGGTDVCSAFVGAVATRPVRAGRIQARCLGVSVEAWDDQGHPVVDEPGELVVTQPMPSMPTHLWGDHDGSRYAETYFSTYPGVWRHGDFIEFAADGSSRVLGRSDSTLNRNGIRIGTAEIYSVVEALAEVGEALVVGIEPDRGGRSVAYEVVLFVQLVDGMTMDHTVETGNRHKIRHALSPRHVPDRIVAASGIPHTRTGKKLEVPVKRVLQGERVTDVVDASAVDDLTLLRWCEQMSTDRHSVPR